MDISPNVKIDSLGGTFYSEGQYYMGITFRYSLMSQEFKDKTSSKLQNSTSLSMKLFKKPTSNTTYESEFGMLSYRGPSLIVAI